MRLLMACSMALVVAACTSGGPPAGTGTPAATQAPVTRQPTTAPTVPPATAAPAPTSTPAGGPTVAPASPGQGGVIVQPYTGDLAGAIPPVIAGQQVQVGLLPAAGMENLDAAMLALIESLGLDLQSVEVVLATDSGSSLIIFALRFPGIDAATLDSTFLATQQATPGTGNFRVVTVAGRNVHAWTTNIGTTYAWVNGNILFWLYGTEQGAQQAIAALPLPTVPLVAGGEELPNAEVDLVITGGPDAGTYHGVTPGSGGCSRNVFSDNSFGLQYSDGQAADGFTSLQVIVRDAADAAGDGTLDFVAIVQIGPMFDGTSYNVDPENDDGDGSVQLQDSGQTAVIVFDGFTADEVRLHATVTCNLVFG